MRLRAGVACRSIGVGQRKLKGRTLGSRPVLKLDIDQWRRRLTHGEMVRRLRWAGYRLRWLVESWSPSGRGLHVVCRVTPLPRTAREVVALQLLLGSDPLREAHNLERARAVDAGLVSRFWRSRWNVLYGKSR